MKSKSYPGSQGGAPVVMGAGFIGLDLILSPAHPGKVQTRLGGSCGNVLLSLSALGWTAVPIGRLDFEDPAFSFLAEELCAWDVCSNLLHLAPTAAVPIITQRTKPAPNGGFAHSFSFRCARCRRYLPGFAPLRVDSAMSLLDRLPMCGVFYLDRASPGNLMLAKAAAAHGALVVFEPSSVGKGPAMKHFREAVSLAHIVKYSCTRLPGFGDDGSFTRSPILEIETLSAAGLRYRRTLPDAAVTGWVTLPAYPVEIIGDSAGAGDWMTAAVLHSLQLGGYCRPDSLCGASNQAIEDALRVGQAAGAWNCQFEGARGGMYGDPGSLSDFIERVAGLRHPMQLVRSGPPPELPPMSLDIAMKKLCPVCRGYESPVASFEKPATPVPIGPWKAVGRPGYVGNRIQAAAAELDHRYGRERWRMAYAWKGETIARDQALESYTRAYEIWFQKNPELLDRLLYMASDVYDLTPEDVRSGTNFSVQTGTAVHLHDIAVRIAVERLGRRFEGGRLIRIRGRESEGAHLSPGVVPFHEPEAILQPELKGWWRPGSVESFWQSNKVLQVRQPPRRTILFGGSFNPIHNGHLALARFTRDRLGFDRVLFIPNGDNYRKPELAPALLRLAMVEAAIEGELGFEVVDSEVHSPDALRVVQTTEELSKAFPEDELVLVRGLDALPKTHHRLFRVPRLRALVLHRSGTAATFDDVLSRHPHLEANRARIELVGETFRFDLSSSEVRAAILEGRPFEHMVPPAVVRILRAEGLYREFSGAGGTQQLVIWLNLKWHYSVLSNL